MGDEHVEVPPDEYDHEPTRIYSVLRTTAAKVVTYCRGIKKACAIPRRRIIVIDETITGEDEADIMRHENAHLNGWQH